MFVCGRNFTPDDKTILCTIDFSESSGQAIEWALTEAEFFFQALLFVDYYGTCIADLRVGLQKELSFILAPTARLLGYRTWRPEYSVKWKKRFGESAKKNNVVSAIRPPGWFVLEIK